MVIPCLDEEKAIGACLQELKGVLAGMGRSAEVIVVDNGSSDGTAGAVAAATAGFPGLRLVREPRRGYGSACRRGLMEARGRHIFLADGDGSYDFSDLPRFIAELDGGADLVVGDRFGGGMEEGSMPWHHKRIGNPLLSIFVRKFFGAKTRDIHCGARAISKDALDGLYLHSDGMEFASEMVMKASRAGMRLSEVPVRYRRRLGTSKLRSMRDGWRHMRFILLYSPLYLFFLPGAALFGLGLIAMAALYIGAPAIFGIQLFVHPMFLAAAAMILGYELVFFAFFAKIYAVTHLHEESAAIERLFKLITVERAGVIGLILILAGAVIYGFIAASWIRSGFGSLDQIKNSVVALTLLVLGAQTIFSAFMLSIVGIDGARDREAS